MFIRSGKIISNKTNKVIIKSTQGKEFELSFAASVIWELFNGERQTYEVAEIVNQNTADDTIDIPSTILPIIKDLKDAQLIIEK
jgi:hypothetical protein